MSRPDRRGRVALGFALAAPIPLGIVAALIVAVVGIVGTRTAVGPHVSAADARAHLAKARARSGLGGARPAVAKTGFVNLSWVGDTSLGSQYGLPAGDGSTLLAGVRGMTRTPDLMLGNLEGTFGTGGTTKCGAGTAGGTCFAFQAPPANVAGLKAAGFDLVNVANNHAYDAGAAGQAQTLAALRGAHIAWTGQPGQVRMLRARGLRIAVLGFAPYPWASSLTDIPAAQRMVTAAAHRADIVVVLMHLGAEGTGAAHVPPGSESYLGEPRGDGRAFTHAVIDAGADLVLGSGPHVLRGMELYKRRLIAYSLGNFAGVHAFATGGNLSLSGLLDVRLNPNGTLQRGLFHSLRLDGGGTPAADPTRAALTFVRGLSDADFGSDAVRFDAVGRFAPPNG